MVVGDFIDTSERQYPDVKEFKCKETEDPRYPRESGMKIRRYFSTSTENPRDRIQGFMVLCSTRFDMS